MNVYFQLCMFSQFFMCAKIFHIFWTLQVNHHLEKPIVISLIRKDANTCVVVQSVCHSWINMPWSIIAAERSENKTAWLPLSEFKQHSSILGLQPQTHSLLCSFFLRCVFLLGRGHNTKIYLKNFLMDRLKTEWHCVGMFDCVSE